MAHADDEGEECRAMMSFGPGDRRAFCLPGRSPAHWTPIGKLFLENYPVDNDEEEDNGRSYLGLVRILCIELWKPSFPTALEDWDLRKPDSPRSRGCYRMSLLRFGSGKNCSWLMENKKLLEMCIHVPYLVFAEQSGQLFIVTRFINVDPYKTVGFSVLKVVQKYGSVDDLRLADNSVEEGGPLDGLAMFVGLNHSFAESSAAELGLKPNSIYFTDVNTRIDERYRHSRGLDTGIFDYANKTLSTLPYYICSSHVHETCVVHSKRVIDFKNI